MGGAKRSCDARPTRRTPGFQDSWPKICTKSSEAHGRSSGRRGPGGAGRCSARGSARRSGPCAGAPLEAIPEVAPTALQRAGARRRSPVGRPRM
eukprot:10020785-Alexandrium_andersonii.AAC.1